LASWTRYRIAYRFWLSSVAKNSAAAGFAVRASVRHIGERSGEIPDARAARS
jgi:hypothetical protein